MKLCFTRVFAENSSLGRNQHQRMQMLWGVSILLLVSVPFVQAKISPATSYHEFIEGVGAFLIVVAIMGRTWCALYIGGRKLKELVQCGPYSIVRNPLYVFSLFGVVGICLGTGSFILTSVIALVSALIFRHLIRLEERALLDQFGPTFTEYAARVPRLWPRFSLWRDAVMVDVIPKRVLRTFCDAALMLLALPAWDLIDTLQQMQILPVLLYLP
jgi:protein-S-isoprenylcysteine O-methyltransferase Ste14